MPNIDVIGLIDILTDILSIFLLLYFLDFALISCFGCTASISVIFALLVNSLVPLCNSVFSMSFMGDCVNWKNFNF